MKRHIELAVLVSILAIAGLYGLSLYRASQVELVEKKRIGAIVKADVQRKLAEFQERERMMHDPEWQRDEWSRSEIAQIMSVFGMGAGQVR